MITRVCTEVRLDVKKGDKMDIRNYVKVKTIPGGSLSECEYVDGIVFTKTLAHKKMRTDIKNPKILLLDCSLEYWISHRLLSLPQIPS